MDGGRLLALRPGGGPTRWLSVACAHCGCCRSSAPAPRRSRWRRSLLLAAADPRHRRPLCITAQHREMLDQVLAPSTSGPTLDLDLMQPDQWLAGLAAAVFSRPRPGAGAVKPDWLVVQGDTTTAMAAALRRSTGGCASGTSRPGCAPATWRVLPGRGEPAHRQLVADLHFAPTEAARRALLVEGVPPERIHVTGNTVVDALQRIADQPYAWDSGPLRQGAAGPQADHRDRPSPRELWSAAGRARISFAAGGRWVFLSTNNGTTWTPGNVAWGGANVTSLAVSGTNLFAGTNGLGVFFSTNNGTTWTGVDPSWSGFRHVLLSGRAVTGANLFAGTGGGGGVFLSTNNGSKLDGSQVRLDEY